MWQSVELISIKNNILNYDFICRFNIYFGLYRHKSMQNEKIFKNILLIVENSGIIWTKNLKRFFSERDDKDD